MEKILIEIGIKPIETKVIPERYASWDLFIILSILLERNYCSDNGSEVDISISFSGGLLGSSFNLVIPKSSLPKAKNAIPNMKNAAIAINGNIYFLKNSLYLYTDFLFYCSLGFITLYWCDL